MIESHGVLVYLRGRLFAWSPLFATKEEGEAWAAPWRNRGRFELVVASSPSGVRFVVRYCEALAEDADRLLPDVAGDLRELAEALRRDRQQSAAAIAGRIAERV